MSTRQQSEEADILTQEAFQRPDGSPLGPGFIGMGRTAIVLREGGTALKIPKLRNLASIPTSQYENMSFYNEMNREKLRNELEVFQRLGNHSGIIKWYKRREEEIELPFLERGDLSKYMRTKEHRPTLAVAVHWIRTVAEALSYCHEKRVFVADIGLRNILLDDNNNVVLIDFADSITFPLDINMDEATDGDVDMQTEIFNFSLVAISILTWKEERYDLYATPPGGSSVGDSLSIKWPLLEAMPCTSNLPFGDIIRKCWLPGSYRNVSQVRDAINDLYLKEGEMYINQYIE